LSLVHVSIITESVDLSIPLFLCLSFLVSFKRRVCLIPQSDRGLLEAHCFSMSLCNCEARPTVSISNPIILLSISVCVLIASHRSDKQTRSKSAHIIYMKSSDAKASKCHLKCSSRMIIFIKLVYLSSVISLKWQ